MSHLSAAGCDGSVWPMSHDHGSHAPAPSAEGIAVVDVAADIAVVDAARAPCRVAVAHGVAVAHIAGKGRGVVATKDIAAGELIEVAAVIPVEGNDSVDGTALEHYVYDWFAAASGVAVALGFGSLYNHSFTPNADYKKDFAAQVIEYRAIAPIRAGCEVLINYNGTPTDQTPLWFRVV